MWATQRDRKKNAKQIIPTAATNRERFVRFCDLRLLATDTNIFVRFRFLSLFIQGLCVCGDTDSMARIRVYIAYRRHDNTMYVLIELRKLKLAHCQQFRFCLQTYRLVHQTID